MSKGLFCVVVVSLLAGCASPNFGSPNVYQSLDVQRAGAIEDATVVGVRLVTIVAPTNHSGVASLFSAATGGLLASRAIGQGKGRYIAGAVAGTAAGIAAQHIAAAAARQPGLEIVVRTTSGRLLVVTQSVDQQFSPGEHVFLVSSSSGIRVTH
jgi:outer membrane lipoprotein SlyB